MRLLLSLRSLAFVVVLVVVEVVVVVLVVVLLLSLLHVAVAAVFLQKIAPTVAIGCRY